MELFVSVYVLFIDRTLDLDLSFDDRISFKTKFIKRGRKQMTETKKLLLTGLLVLVLIPFSGCSDTEKNNPAKGGDAGM